jgi:hypothetical protein
MINLLFFVISMTVDNLLYFLKGCMVNNVEWGSYHQIEEGEKIQAKESVAIRK